MQVIKKIRLSDEELESMKLAVAIGAQICTVLDKECIMCPLFQYTDGTNACDTCQCTVELLGQAIRELRGKQ